MLKKLTAILTAAVLFTSCGIFSKDSEESPPVDEKIIAKELGENVMTAIQNEDVDALADLFCQYTVEEYGDDLKPEIQKIYDYIDGEIISHDEIETRETLEETTEEDGVVIYSYNATIQNVITDKGNKYLIGCRGYSVYKENPKLVGFVRLYVQDEDKFEYVLKNYEDENIEDYMFSFQVGYLPGEKDE